LPLKWIALSTRSNGGANGSESNRLFIFIPASGGRARRQTTFTKAGLNFPKMNTHLQPWAKAMEKLVLKKLRDIGGTGNAREIAQAIEQPLENVSPRLNALSHAGLIRDTGQRESVGRGRPLIVWTLNGNSQEVADEIAAEFNIKPKPEQPAWFARYGQ
jgi:hypothetical protein